MYMLKYKWAMIAQNTNEFGELGIVKIFPYDQLTTCDQAASILMKIYPWMEAACFLVY
jgi:hypothetical protein